MIDNKINDWIFYLLEIEKSKRPISCVHFLGIPHHPDFVTNSKNQCKYHFDDSKKLFVYIEKSTCP